MTGGKVRQYPYFVRLFHPSTPLRSVELSKEWLRFRDQGKRVTLSWLYQTIPHFYTSEKFGTWDEKVSRVISHFHTKESRDLVASAGHLWPHAAQLIICWLTGCMKSKLCLWQVGFHIRWRRWLHRLIDENLLGRGFDFERRVAMKTIVLLFYYSLTS